MKASARRQRTIPVRFSENQLVMLLKLVEERSASLRIQHASYSQRPSSRASACASPQPSTPKGVIINPNHTSNMQPDNQPTSRYERLKAEYMAKYARRRPSDEEHHIQTACVTWFRLQYPRYIHNLFAVPNGGLRSAATSGKLKAEGTLSGVADLILLKSNARYGALLVEMKTPKGHQSPAQRAWQSLIEADGYHYVVCRSLDDFMREVNEYLSDVNH